MLLWRLLACRLRAQVLREAATTSEALYPALALRFRVLRRIFSSGIGVSCLRLVRSCGALARACPKMGDVGGGSVSELRALVRHL